MENELMLPFLNSDPMFAAGVEIGMLYRDMRNGEVNGITGYYQTENQEQITLMANRLGWHINSIQVWPEGPEWTLIEMERRQPDKHHIKE